MMRTSPGLGLLALLVPTTACSVFDLAELKDGDGTGDASVPVEPDAATPGDEPDAMPLPDPVDSGPDAHYDPAIPDGGALGSCNPERWVASASASHPANPPVHAIDGLLPSRWSSGNAQAAGEYFEIDFGGFVMVNQVAINPVFLNDGVGDYPRGIDIYTSYDGVDYSRHLGSATFFADPGIATVEFPPHAARHLRLTLNQGTGSWFTIHELTVGCTVPGGETTPDAGPLNPGPDGGLIENRSTWTAVGLPTNPGDVATNAFDGNAGTRWASGKSPQYGDEVYELDLGAVTEVSGVELHALPNDFASAFAVDLSTDHTTYTEVARGLGAEVARLSFVRQSARYIRVRQIGAGHPHWWGINEIQVVK